MKSLILTLVLLLCVSYTLADEDTVKASKLLLAAITGWCKYHFEFSESFTLEILIVKQVLTHELVELEEELSVRHVLYL